MSSPSSGRVLIRAEEVDAHVRLVADDDRVVAGTDLEQIARSELEGPAVGHLNPVAAREHQPEMRDLADRLAQCGPDVLRPAPAGLVLGAADRHPADLHEVEAAEREVPVVVRIVEAADDGRGFGHRQPPSESSLYRSGS